MTYDSKRSLFENLGFVRPKIAADEWRTREGLILKICNMNDGHLKATIALIERTAVAENSKPEEYEKYKELCAERDRRCEK